MQDGYGKEMDRSSLLTPRSKTPMEPSAMSEVCKSGLATGVRARASV